MLEEYEKKVLMMLQFQKIFVLSLPNRRDKRDAVTLSAYISGLEIEFVDGVNGSEVSTKEWPEVRPSEHIWLH